MSKTRRKNNTDHVKKYDDLTVIREILDRNGIAYEFDAGERCISVPLNQSTDHVSFLCAVFEFNSRGELTDILEGELS